MAYYSGDKDCDCEDEKVTLAQRLAIDDSGVRDTGSPILAPGFALRPESEHTGKPCTPCNVTLLFLAENSFLDPVPDICLTYAWR